MHLEFELLELWKGLTMPDNVFAAAERPLKYGKIELLVDGKLVASAAPRIATDVYLITSGDGSDGDEWEVHEICADKETAALLLAALQCNPNRHYNEIERWDLKSIKRAA